ncbi:cupredoxin family copper-binding protein [Paraburkholderia sp. RL18-103-BIB-C]|jgi:plastocyanin|uniref:cupredoxin domain-containing protein n=1 Tax=unclassified Paraburkholderia TaxID=2615204 RepID=UPI002F81C390
MPTIRIGRALFVFLSGSAVIAASAAICVARAETPNAVVIKNFMFSPMALTIKAGSTVTWKNLDGEPHTVVNDAGMFRSAALDQNDSYQYKFDKPGVYNVFCGIHPNMKEKITVQ